MNNKFWERVNKGPPDQCWEWKGYRVKSKLSYGSYRFEGKQWRAHRLAYLFHYGKLPMEMFVCHSCDNPPCCNPAHLWLGTALDNNRDRERKGRGVHVCGKRDGINYVRGKSHGLAKLTESMINPIREDKRPQRTIARDYGVHQKAISLIKLGQTWQHVPLTEAAIRAMRGKP